MNIYSEIHTVPLWRENKKIQYVPSLFNVHIAYFPYISVIFVASTRLNLFLPYNKIRDKILKTNYKNTLCLWYKKWKTQIEDKSVTDAHIPLYPLFLNYVSLKTVETIMKETKLIFIFS